MALLDEATICDSYFASRKYLEQSMCIVKKKQPEREERVELDFKEVKEVDLTTQKLEPEQIYNIFW